MIFVSVHYLSNRQWKKEEGCASSCRQGTSWTWTRTWSWSCCWLWFGRGFWPGQRGSTLRRLSESPPKGNVKGMPLDVCCRCCEPYPSSWIPIPSPWKPTLPPGFSCFLMMIERRRRPQLGKPCCILSRCKS